LASIVQQSNLYHSQIKPDDDKWKDITFEELKAFLGILIAMGLLDLPKFHDYWSRGNLLSVPWFATIMPRDRFFEILRYLHLSNKENEPPRDDPSHKLYKLGDLLSKVNDIFAKRYKPERHLSVDEQMIGTRCRIGFIQYMPKKPVKFGIKLWVICEADSGYCLKFQVYTGKVDDGPERGLAYRIVFDLIKDYLDRNYFLYYDNFYSTLKLFQDLENRKVFACGTIRSYRGQFPHTFRYAALQTGESKFMRIGNLVGVHWKDKRDVFVLSTIHGTAVEMVQRRRGDPITKPEMICDYNNHMNGVDKCDQYLSSYTFCRKTVKWWKKVFVRVFELCVINSMIIYFKKHPEFQQKYQSHKKFREMLVHDLVQPLLDKISSGEIVYGKRKPNDIAANRLTGKHFSVSKFPERKACHNCGHSKSKNGYKGKKTNMYCPKCDKFICKACFEPYHTLSNPKK